MDADATRRRQKRALPLSFLLSPSLHLLFLLRYFAFIINADNYSQREAITTARSCDRREAVCSSSSSSTTFSFYLSLSPAVWSSINWPSFAIGRQNCGPQSRRWP